MFHFFEDNQVNKIGKGYAYYSSPFIMFVDF